MTPVSMAGFTNMTAMSSRSVSEPFAATRDGFVIAEGAAVLDPRGVGRRRGPRRHDPRRGARRRVHRRRPPHHRPLARRPRRAVVHGARARRRRASAPRDVAHVNAHGTSTPLNDAAEAEAMAKLFGTPGPPVTSIKGVTGHSLGAAGAIEAVAVVESMRRGLIPPTAVTTEVDPELPADRPRRSARPGPGRPAPRCRNSFGFGGHNGTLVLGPGCSPVCGRRSRVADARATDPVRTGSGRRTRARGA